MPAKIDPILPSAAESNHEEEEEKGLFDEYEYEEKEQSFFEMVSYQLHSAIVAAIPSDQINNLHPSYFYPIAVFIGLLFAGAFLASFLPGYFQGVSYRYLSPVENSKPEYCSPIPLSITGTFFGAPTGYWEGSEGFSYSDATYIIKVTNYQSTSAEFDVNMHRIDWALHYYGKIGKQFDLAFNLLIWTSMVLIEGRNNNQKFHMNGSPIKIFDRQVLAARTSSLTGDCNVPSKTIFDTATGLLSVTYSHTAFMADPTCVATATPGNLGYSTYANADDFSLKFDVRTMVTALAVNMHMLNLTALQSIRTTYTQTILGFPMKAYIDPRYPGMQPVTCVVLMGYPLCVLLVGQTFALPIFNHIGKSPYSPDPCVCEQYDSYPDATKAKCNEFNFVLGVLFYDTTDAMDILQLFTTSASFLYPGMFGINIYSYFPMFMGTSNGMLSPARPYYFTNSTFREKLYHFCHTTTGRYCHYVTFSLYDDNNPSHTVTDYFYQLTEGACRDSYSAHKGNWANLTTTPFTQLTQDYEVCRSDMQTVFLNQLGNTVGNMGVFAPVITFLVLTLMFFIQKCTGFKIPTRYGAEEKKEILDQLAITLLLIKEGKLNPTKLIYGTSSAAIKRQQSHAASAMPLLPHHPSSRRRLAFGAGGAGAESSTSPRSMDDSHLNLYSSSDMAGGYTSSSLEHLALELKSLEKMKFHKLHKLPIAATTPTPLAGSHSNSQSFSGNRGESMKKLIPTNPQLVSATSSLKQPPFVAELVPIVDQDEEQGYGGGSRKVDKGPPPPSIKYPSVKASAVIESYSPRSIPDEVLEL